MGGEMTPLYRIAADHPEGTCEDCYGRNTVWFAPSDVWNPTVRGAYDGPDIMLCPRCFAIRADRLNLAPFGWMLIPAPYRAAKGE